MDTKHIDITAKISPFAGLAGKHVLLLQGPMGPFFRRFATELEGFGASVSKVNFNGGDELYYRGSGTVAYRGSLDAWPTWLGELCLARQVDVIFLFGDCRDYHRSAMRVAEDLRIPVYVFEEGYLRPDFITLERGGVNGHSSMSPELEFGRGADIASHAAPVGKTFWRGAAYAAGYSWALTLLAWRFPGYAHHRDLHPIREALRWIRGGARKLLWKYRDRKALERLTGSCSGRYFLVPLQVHNDFQLGHSRFGSVEAFLREVVASFAAHAPSDQLLVVKHHPMDRPYRDYTQLIRELVAKHDLEGRLIYVADLHLPTLLRHARGAVVINSTVGLQALLYGTPLIAQGQAVYNLPGLSAQDSLSEFWQRPGKVDMPAVACFVDWLKHHNQSNGSFIRPLPAGGRTGTSGIRWFGGSAIQVRAPLDPVEAKERRASAQGTSPLLGSVKAPQLRAGEPPIPAGLTPSMTPGPAAVGGE